MAVIIDATLGGTNSNSYVTLIEANGYFEARLHTEYWDSADDDTKNRSLVMATRRIEQESFYGDRATSTQRLKFPRINLGYLDGILLDNIIPEMLKEAQYELAIHLLSTDMSQPSVDTGAIAEAKVGSVSVKYAVDKNDNVSTSYDELPPFVSSLLADISTTVSGGGYVYIGR